MAAAPVNNDGNEGDVDVEDRQIIIPNIGNIRCPGSGVKAFVFELYQFIFGSENLYNWKRCSRVGTIGGCGSNGYCCRHPFGDNVCYRRSYLRDNRARLL